MKSNPPRLNKGFTLIEVVIALAILTWVLGSAIYLVNQYASERSRMREAFNGNQVAWNQLMDHYSVAQGWRPENYSFSLEERGQEEQGGQPWYWQLERTSASGEGLFRYKVNAATTQSASSQQAGDAHDSNNGASLSLFLLNQEGE